VVLTEWSAPEEGGSCPALHVDGSPMRLRGTVDRIEIHEDGRRVAIFDYKTSDRADPPERTHGSGDTWTDLQLPLYRVLIGSASEALYEAGLDRFDGLDPNRPGAIELGYITMPRELEKTAFRLAEWDADAIGTALRAAEDVVRGVRGMQFFAPGERPPAVGAVASLLRTGPVARAGDES
jgi:hypothetical protein